MSEQNRDDFYEGPPIDDPERWHDAPVFDESAPAGEEGAGPSATPTADPSRSRAVDREDAGLAPDAAGYDRQNEGPPAGPLEPDAQAG